MKKLVLCVSLYLMTGLTPTVHVGASESIANVETVVNSYIKNLYQQIDFGKGDELSFEVFSKAYRGYINLKNSGKLNNDRQVLSVCDFTKSSTKNRLWVIDLKAKKVVFNTLVAHGAGTGEEFARDFSNNFDSHQSSIGFYVTGDTYIGQHGNSLRLQGMDQGYNNNAYDRAIVVHGADYVSKSFVKGNDRLGRSWGCPAVSSELAQPIINTIKDGTCLFIYYPKKDYLKTAYWMNKSIGELPQDLRADMDNMLLASNTTVNVKGKKKPMKVQYDMSTIPQVRMSLPL